MAANIDAAVQMLRNSYTPASPGYYLLHVHPDVTWNWELADLGKELLTYRARCLVNELANLAYRRRTKFGTPLPSPREIIIRAMKLT